MSDSVKIRSESQICPTCGTRLAPETSPELCPSCLLEAGLPTEQAVGPGGTIYVRPEHGAASKGLPRAGEEFGHYKLIRLLGGGGMGVVYEAEEAESSRRVALKLLAQALDSPQARKRFLREGQVAAAINHPNSVYVFGTEEIAGTPVISMELMAGGTLQDRVAASGPMPIPAAVDSILQVVAGLEAAQQSGILHRDIKPSNCFVDADGTVKVGDFGLSISTSIRGEASLTATGHIMGTPAFSSPEQLRGEELTARSDIYAVGVTLYFLLTGRTPFQAPNVVQMLATVLEKKPEPPTTFRSEIPTDLSRSILRCLEKDAGERFPDYAQLREALLPFGSGAPSPAKLGRRFFAGFVDLTVAGGVAQLLESGIPLGWTPFYPLLLLYFTLAEGKCGVSLGKWIFGLKLVSATPKALGPGRAFIRALIFLLVFFSFDLAVVLILSRFNAGHNAASGIIAIVAMTFPLLLLFGTARRANGWRAIQDLVTRSRVVQKSASPVRSAVMLASEIPKSEDSRQVGPYHVLESLGRSDGAEVLLAYDARLLRKVWIRKVPDDAPAVPPELRRLSRPGRLRWLAGRRVPGDCWDAYEGLSGKPLLELTAGKPGWEQARFWLLDLAMELQGANDQWMGQKLKLEHVWITEQGRAKLLDFPVPTGRTEEINGLPLSESQFLLRIAAAALMGEADERIQGATSALAIPLPLHARAIVASLQNGTGASNIIPQLKKSLTRPASVSRLRRLAMFLATLWAPIFLTLIAMLADSAPRLKASAELRTLQTCLNRLESLPSDSDAAEQREAFEIYIAGRFPSVITNSWAMAQGPAADIERHEAAARQILASRGEPSPDEFAAAKGFVEKHVPAIKSEPAIGMRSADPEARWVWIIGLGTLYGLCVVVLPGWIAALAFRGGVLLRSFGLAVVKRNGEPASRGRILWRNSIASAPFLIAAYALHGQERWIAVLPLVVAIALAVCSALMRGRTLHDRLAGTELVPG